MNQITLTRSTLRIAKIVELVNNFNYGIDKYLGVCAETFVHCVDNYVNNKDFKNYLLKNNEAELFLKLVGNPGEVSGAIARQLFKQSPDGYVEFLNRYQQRDVPSSFRDMLDSHFEEIAPLAKKYIEGCYLPKRHLNNSRLVMSLAKKQIGYVSYMNTEELLIEAVKDHPDILQFKNADVTGKTLLMRKLCKANPQCAAYACSPITTKAAVTSHDSKTEKMRKVNAWLQATGDRKLINNASGGGMPRVKTVAAPKPKFKI